MRLVSRIWCVLACAVLLVACGNDVPSPESGDATAVATPHSDGVDGDAPSAPEMDVGEIIWAQAVEPETGEPTDIVTRFNTESPAIIAVIEVSEVPSGTGFTASWTINDQSIDGIDMDISSSDDLEHAWIAFSFTRDEGQLYPIGQLNVVITTSEGDLREGSIEIGFP